MATAKKKAPAKKAAPEKKASPAKKTVSKKPKSDAPDPIKGPKGPGQYNVRYMQNGKWVQSIGGRNIPWNYSGGNSGAGMGGTTPRGFGGGLRSHGK
jgi:hypothetical protein